MAADRCFNIQVRGHVPAIAQPSSRACWATVGAMMISWKHRQSFTIEEAMAKVGNPYLSIYKNNRVLPWRQHTAFARAAGMKIVGLMSFTAEGFADLLRRSRGPLFVVIHPHGNPRNLTHIVLVTGIAGDGTTNGTTVKFIDPNGGTRRTLSYQNFAQRYEGAARTQLTAQILHY